MAHKIFVQNFNCRNCSLYNPPPTVVKCLSHCSRLGASEGRQTVKGEEYLFIPETGPSMGPSFSQKLCHCPPPRGYEEGLTSHTVVEKHDLHKQKVDHKVCTAAKCQTTLWCARIAQICSACPYPSRSALGQPPSKTSVLNARGDTSGTCDAADPRTGTANVLCCTAAELHKTCRCEAPRGPSANIPRIEQKHGSW